MVFEAVVHWEPSRTAYNRGWASRLVYMKHKALHISLSTSPTFLDIIDAKQICVLGNPAAHPRHCCICSDFARAAAIAAATVRPVPRTSTPVEPACSTQCIKGVFVHSWCHIMATSLPVCAWRVCPRAAARGQRQAGRPQSSLQQRS